MSSRERRIKIQNPKPPRTQKVLTFKGESGRRKGTKRRRDQKKRATHGRVSLPKGKETIKKGRGGHWTTPKAKAACHEGRQVREMGKTEQGMSRGERGGGGSRKKSIAVLSGKDKIIGEEIKGKGGEIGKVQKGEQISRCSVPHAIEKRKHFHKSSEVQTTDHRK